MSTIGKSTPTEATPSTRTFSLEPTAIKKTNTKKLGDAELFLVSCHMYSGFLVLLVFSNQGGAHPTYSKKETPITNGITLYFYISINIHTCYVYVCM